MADAAEVCLFVLLLPLLLAAPLLLLAGAVAGLADQGPAGWAAAVGLLLATGWATRFVVRRLLRLWRSVRAGEILSEPQNWG